MGLKLLASFKMTKIACCLAFCTLIYHDEVTKRKVQNFLLDRHVGVSVFELLPYNVEGNEESCKHSQWYFQLQIMLHAEINFWVGKKWKMEMYLHVGTR